MPVISADFEYYADVLQVPYDVAVNDLKSAYDGIARFLHPKNGGSAEVFQVILRCAQPVHYLQRSALFVRIVPLVLKASYLSIFLVLPPLF